MSNKDYVYFLSLNGLLLAQIYIDLTLVTKSIDILCESCKVILISNLIF
jgi:hypothetical protein